MIAIYVELIHKGRRTIDQVPARIREDVRKAYEEKYGSLSG